MKKQLIMMACMLMASIAAFAGTNSKILLQHEGGVKVYDSNQMTQALADAVKGDTLFLSEGTFAGFDLTKEVMVRGCGTTTIITGAVKIAVAGNPTFSAPLLDALKIDNSLTVSQPCNKLHIRKCKITGDISFSAKSEDVLIDRCSNINSNFKKFTMSSNIVSMTVMNSFIDYLYSNGVTGNVVTFINCNILSRYSEIANQTFINCIFGYGGYFYSSSYSSYSSSSSYSSYKLTNCTLLNCLYNTNSSLPYNSYVGNSILQSCYGVDNETSLLTDLSKDALLANGYLGNDGTIVGIQGGNTPFVSDMLPAAPKVTDQSISLDLENKKLNVSLKVTAE